MSKRQPNPGATTVLCAKLTDDTHTFLESWDPQGRETVEDIAVPLMDQNLVTANSPLRSCTVLTLTDQGKAVAATVRPEDLCGPQDDPAKRADAAMWLFLVTNGAVPGGYGSTYQWGRNGEIAHLIVCGLDLAKSSMVRDDRWTEWGGTFGEDSTIVGISGDATCSCRKVKDLTINFEVESMLALIRGITAHL